MPIRMRTNLTQLVNLIELKVLFAIGHEVPQEGSHQVN